MLVCRATDDSRKLRYRRYFDVVYSSCWCRVHGILNESRSLPAFFFPPRRLTYLTCLLYRPCFENSRTYVHERGYTNRRALQAYIARAGAWPFLSPFLPFAATVDRFFFFCRSSFHRAKQGVSNTDFYRGQTIHSTFHRFMSIFMSELYICFHYTYYETCSRHLIMYI